MGKEKRGRAELSETVFSREASLEVSLLKPPELYDTKTLIYSCTRFIRPRRLEFLTEGP